jgi:hypothetical protein
MENIEIERPRIPSKNQADKIINSKDFWQAPKEQKPMLS